MRPKVLIIYDRPGWCHDMIAHSIQHFYGEGKAEIHTAWQGNRNIKKQVASVDLILPLCWLTLRSVSCAIEKTLVGIRGYASLPASPVPGTGLTVRDVVRRSAGLICANVDLADRWRVKQKNVFVGYSAVDPRLWKLPAKPKRIINPLIVGWAGNEERSVKRVQTLLKPAIEKTNGAVILKIAGRKNYIPTREMREKFYYRIDALACTSVTEGTPNPALEAMMCGVPVASTRVGHLREMIMYDVNGWLLDASVGAFTRLFKELAFNHERIYANGRAAHKTAQTWTWKTKIEGWRRAIDETLRRLGHA